MRKILSIIFILLSSANLIEAQSVSVKADKYKVLIGQKITIDLNVSLSIEAQVEWPDLKKDSLLKNFEIITESTIDTVPSTDNEFLKLSKKLELISFEPGIQRFPSLPFSIFGKGKSEPVNLFSDELIIDVQAVQVDTTQQIKDIKEIMNVPISLEEMLPWIGLVILVLIIISLILLWLAKRKKPNTVAEVKASSIPPYEQLMIDLKTIHDQQIWRKGLVKAYHSSIVDSLRIYIENEWNIRAMELTSDEMISLLSKDENFTNALPLIKQLFNRADLVKFAKQNPTEHEHLQSLDWANQIAQTLHQEKNKSAIAGKEDKTND